MIRIDVTIGAEAGEFDEHATTLDILPSLKEGDSYGATHEIPHA